MIKKKNWKLHRWCAHLECGRWLVLAPVWQNH